MALDLGQMLQGGANSGSYTPETLARRQKMAEALLGKSMGIQNIEHPLQGLAQMLNAGIGAYRLREADEQEAAERERANKMMADLLSQGAGVDDGALMGAMADPWTSDASARLGQILLGENLANRRQQAEWAREDAQMADERAYNQPMLDADLAYKLAQTEALNAKPAVPLTDDQREYQMAVDQGFEGTLQDWLAAKPTSSNVTVNTGDNSSAFQKKADETAATRLSDIVTAGQDASRFMGDMKTLASLGPQIGTGKGAEVVAALGPYAQALGFDVGGLDEAQAYQAIVDRMAPAMRPAGSGAASDFDARQFLSSLPSLGRTPEGNAIIIQTLSALQQHRIASAEIARRALSGNITWQEADQEIAGLGDPFTAFNEYNGGRSPQSGPTQNAVKTQDAPKAPDVGVVEDGYRFKGGDPADPNNWEKVQ